MNFEKGNLSVRAVEGGKTSTLTANANGDSINNGRAVWSPDSKWIAFMETDVTAVEQIIFNLVDNACKYGRGVDGGTIRVTGSANGRRAAVAVRDDGPGVAAEEGKRLFRPFHKSATEAAHTQPGVGLGLALSRRLAKALGGRLELANPGESGAEFRLELPLG